MAKNKLNKSWVNRHVNDHFVHLANKNGYRSRAAYKLLEFEDEYNLFKNVNVVVDLGCAPGSWSQVAIKCLKKTSNHSLLIGVDLLNTKPIDGLTFICGDFSSEDIINQLVESLGGHKPDLIISDIAPEFSGVKSVDQVKSAYLVELVLDFAQNYLKIGGNLLVKIFHGSEFENLVKLARSIFTQVLIKKPQASRTESAEIYLLCKSKK